MTPSMKNLILLFLTTPFTTTQSFSFQLPKFPWDTPLKQPATQPPKSPITPNNKIVIFGATGRVGQLVTKKLLNRQWLGYRVCVVARDADRARELLLADNDGGNGERLDVAQLNLVGEGKASDEELREVMNDATTIVISVGTTAFPTQRWKNGNTPKAINCEAVSRIADLATSITDNKLRRMVLLTSMGVSHTNELPFIILNLFGVLDSKCTGGETIKTACRANNVSYSIIRPGRLVGGSYTNLDLANLFKIEGGAENGVTLQSGDSLLGDCKRDATAEAIIQALEIESCVDVELF